MKTDILSVIEAGYQVDSPAQTWLEGVGRQVHDQCGAGLGLLGCLFEVTPDFQLRVGEAIEIGMPAGMSGAFKASFEQLPDWYVQQTFAVQCGAATSSDPGNNRVQAQNEALLEVMSQTFGWQDVFIVAGMDPSRRGAYFGAWLPQRRRLSASERAVWTRVAIHLATAHRLRLRLSDAERTTPSTADAILTPEGRVDHARDEAEPSEVRAELRQAVVAIERVRQRARSGEPRRTVDVWQALVSGRWSLVDHFDSDGKRYVLARRNDVAVAGFDELAVRERQAVAYAALGHSNKLIAYEMGITASTVGVLLTRAGRKLGTKGRKELIDRFNSAQSKPQKPR